MTIIKRITTAVFFLALMTTFTGCINFIEEIFLNKDGSGKYIFTMDLAGLTQLGAMDNMGDLFGGDAKEKDEGTWSDIQEPDTTELEEPAPQIMDSIVSIEEFLEGNIADVEDIDFWREKVKVRMQVNSEENIMKTSFILEFDDVSDINYFYEHFDDIGGKSDNMLNGNSMEELFGGVAFEMKGKKFIRRGQIKSTIEAMTEEEQQVWNMMKMFLATAQYKLIVNFEDAKVKKVTNDKARISGDNKKVTTKVSLMEYMEGKVSLENTIKFK